MKTSEKVTIIVCKILEQSKPIISSVASKPKEKWRKGNMMNTYTINESRRNTKEK